jgi:hypothetical protein
MKFSIYEEVLWVLLLYQSTLVLAGAAWFPACVIACCKGVGGPATSAGPLGIITGFTGCTGVCITACSLLVWAPPACFSNDTTIAVATPDGTLLQKPISAVHAGDYTLTMIDGQLSNTRVIRNTQSSGSFDLFEFEVRSNHTVSTLKVTPQHGMLLVDQLGELRFSFPADVRIGDEMMSSDSSPWKVSRIGHFVGAEKFTLETAEGSVLASGLLVSTVCEEEISPGIRMDDIMPGWKARHQYRLHAHLQETSSEA